MTQQSQKASVQKAEVAKLVRDLAPSAKKCSDAFHRSEKATTSIKDAILEKKDQLIKLLELFCVTPGVPSKSILIEGVYHKRDEYIRAHWSVTPQHVLQVLGLIVKSKSKKKPKDIRETEAYKLGHDEGVADGETPDLKKLLADGINRRDEIRLGIVRDSFTNTHQTDTFAFNLNALLDAIENATEPVSIALHDLAKTVREKFTKATARANEAMIKPENFLPADDFFATATQPEVGDALPAPPKRITATSKRAAKKAVKEIAVAITNAIPPVVTAKVAEINDVAASFCTGSSLADLIREEAV